MTPGFHIGNVAVSHSSATWLRGDLNVASEGIPGAWHSGCSGNVLFLLLLESRRGQFGTTAPLLTP